MDTQSSRFKLTAIIAIPLAIVSFWLPNAFRVQWVASMGVLRANMWMWVGYVVGGVALAVLAAVGIPTFIRYTALENARRAAALEAKRAADAAEQEEKLWKMLPERDEVNPDVLEPMLQRIAKRYPDAYPELLEVTFDQLTSIRDSLKKIRDIFDANAGMISHDDRLASSERFIELLLQEVCPGLVRIVYQAHGNLTDDKSFIDDLIDVIKSVNAENQSRVDVTRKLTNGVVRASTEGNTDSVVSQVKDAADKLTTKKEEGWLR